MSYATVSGRVGHRGLGMHVGARGLGMHVGARGFGDYLEVGDDAKKEQLKKAKFTAANKAACTAAGGVVQINPDGSGTCVLPPSAGGGSTPILSEEGFGLPGGNVTLIVGGLALAAGAAFLVMKKMKKRAA